MSRLFFLLTLYGLFFAVAHQTIQAQALPAGVKTKLNKSYTGWRLHSGDPVCQSRAVMSGDFDGNGKTDYAVMFKKGHLGYIIAFLAAGADYKVVVLESGAADDMKHSYLSVAKKGESYAGVIDGDFDKAETKKLKTDVPVGGTCEASEYFYVYGNGKFKQVFTSD